MPRPRCSKKLAKIPPYTVYLPEGRKLEEIEKNILSLEEFSAIKLCGNQMCSMQAGAAAMGISPATFQRIKKRGQHKICNAICNGKAIIIESNYSLNNTIMPNQDGTGPQGKGQRTGKGEGKCSQESNPQRRSMGRGRCRNKKCRED